MKKVNSLLLLISAGGRYDGGIWQNKRRKNSRKEKKTKAVIQGRRNEKAKRMKKATEN